MLILSGNKIGYWTTLYTSQRLKQPHPGPLLGDRRMEQQLNLPADKRAHHDGRHEVRNP